MCVCFWHKVWPHTIYRLTINYRYLIGVNVKQVSCENISVMYLSPRKSGRFALTSTATVKDFFLKRDISIIFLSILGCLQFYPSLILIASFTVYCLLLLRGRTRNSWDQGEGQKLKIYLPFYIELNVIKIEQSKVIDWGPLEPILSSYCQRSFFIYLHKTYLLR